MQDQRWLTVQQVAEQLQVHPETVREWLRDGKLRGHRISRRAGWRVPVDEVERFMTGGERADEAQANQ